MTRQADLHPQMPLLVARGVSKSFGPVAALVDVDFDVDAGEDVGAAITGGIVAPAAPPVEGVGGVTPCG